jgi:predicted nucleotidyltransferase
MDRNQKFRVIVEILEKEGAEKASIFGSFARGEETDKSDIDIIVKFNQTKSLLDLARIERIISEKIGIKADLQTEKSISPYMAKYIEEEKMALI